jgi:hypothetical protein
VHYDEVFCAVALKEGTTKNIHHFEVTGLTNPPKQGLLKSAVLGALVEPSGAPHAR